MWIMHDGAPAHFSHVVWDVLNNTYHNWWIGREGPTAQSPCSPDFNPLDFILWGYLRAFVYPVPVHNMEALHRHFVNACQTIHSYPRIFEWVWQSMMRITQAC
jgi:hypothetical protein